MNCIITVLGKDRVGIIAAVTSLLAKKNANVLDISQTILGGIFTMNMYVDVSQSGDFASLANELSELGHELGVVIEIRHENIFNAMHRL